VERAELDRTDRAVTAAVLAEDHHLGRRRRLHDLLERLQPVLRALGMGWQAEIEADHRRLLAGERGEGLGAALGQEEREVVAQRVLELRADRLLVLDDEQLGLHVRPSNGSPSGASCRRPSSDFMRATVWATVSSVSRRKSRSSRRLSALSLRVERAAIELL